MVPSKDSLKVGSLKPRFSHGEPTIERKMRTFLEKMYSGEIRCSSSRFAKQNKVRERKRKRRRIRKGNGNE